MSRPASDYITSCESGVTAESGPFPRATPPEQADCPYPTFGLPTQLLRAHPPQELSAYAEEAPCHGRTSRPMTQRRNILHLLRTAPRSLAIVTLSVLVLLASTGLRLAPSDTPAGPPRVTDAGPCGCCGGSARTCPAGCRCCGSPTRATGRSDAVRPGALAVVSARCCDTSGSPDWPTIGPWLIERVVSGRSPDQPRSASPAHQDGALSLAISPPSPPPRA